MVANNSVSSIEKKGELFNIHIYSDKFQEDLDWHRINNLECIYAPLGNLKRRENLLFYF
jgi:hypothetical protein